jgi:hypothetical protein
VSFRQLTGAKPERNSRIPKTSLPRDPNELAHRIFLESIGESPKTEAHAVKEKNPAAVALGRLGGLKGGIARAAKRWGKE